MPQRKKGNTALPKENYMASNPSSNKSEPSSEPSKISSPSVQAGSDPEPNQRNEPLKPASPRIDRGQPPHEPRPEKVMAFKPGQKDVPRKDPKSDPQQHQQKPQQKPGGSHKPTTSSTPDGSGK